MSQDYELTSFKTSDFKDTFGNTWCDVAFLGVSEPVKWVVKDVSKPQIGRTYYGRIEEKTSKAGKPYLRFYTEQKDEEKQKKDEYWDDKNLTIRAQWAIGQAVSVAGEYPSADILIKDENAGTVYLDNVEYLAGEFFAMADRVKGGKEAPKEAPVAKDKDGVEVTDKDLDEPINLDDIPF